MASQRTGCGAGGVGGRGVQDGQCLPGRAFLPSLSGLSHLLPPIVQQPLLLGKSSANSHILLGLFVNVLWVQFQMGAWS